ncbi:ABC transporter permease [Virgibacillus proomii]|uniref:ABC transporter permease n=1 Tax=Virgibacillus proomii TaxID=84407 RepID=UPI0009852C7A|nr:ABC transporter permease [Virgibacillus proomii]
MKAIIQTRFLHWKHQFPALLFWLVLPIGVILGFNYAVTAIQADSKVPVGIVIEDKSTTARELVDKMNEAPFIRVKQLDKEQALQQLEKHELDSVFIIKEGYEKQVNSGSRNRLLTSYQSDLSFAYTPVSEMIASFVQKDTGRAKTAYTILQLEEQLTTNTHWNIEEIITTSKEIEAEQDLLKASFQFKGQAKTNETNLKLWDHWGLWALFSTLATFFLFDWLVKETRSSVRTRFAFIRFSYKTYALLNLLVYTVLLFVIDLAAAFIFSYVFGEAINLSRIAAIVSFRLMINGFAFLLAISMKQIVAYYSLSLVITLLLALTSGAIIPIDGLPFLSVLHPLVPFLNGIFHNIWLYMVVLIICLWYGRKENQYA